MVRFASFNLDHLTGIRNIGCSGNLFSESVLVITNQTVYPVGPDISEAIELADNTITLHLRRRNSDHIGLITDKINTALNINWLKTREDGIDEELVLFVPN